MIVDAGGVGYRNAGLEESTGCVIDDNRVSVCLV